VFLYCWTGSFHGSDWAFHGPEWAFHGSKLIFHDSKWAFHSSKLIFHDSKWGFHGSILAFHDSIFSFHDSKWAFHGSIFSFHDSKRTVHGTKLGGCWYKVRTPAPQSDGRLSCLAYCSRAHAARTWSLAGWARRHWRSTLKLNISKSRRTRWVGVPEWIVLCSILYRLSCVWAQLDHFLIFYEFLKSCRSKRLKVEITRKIFILRGNDRRLKLFRIKFSIEWCAWSLICFNFKFSIGLWNFPGTGGWRGGPGYGAPAAASLGSHTALPSNLSYFS
jgi:hypothetical protein